VIKKTTADRMRKAMPRLIPAKAPAMVIRFVLNTVADDLGNNGGLQEIWSLRWLKQEGRY
jgi:hypothetical protein